MSESLSEGLAVPRTPKGEDVGFVVGKGDDIFEEAGTPEVGIPEKGENLSPFDGSGAIREDSSWLNSSLKLANAKKNRRG